MKAVALLGLLAFLASCDTRAPQGEEATEQQNASEQIPSATCAGSTSPQAERRTVSIVPQFSASKIHANYWPVLKDIGEQTNLCFVIKQQKSIPAFEAALKTKSIDYAFMNPYHQVMMEATFRPIIRDKNRLLTGIIVVNKDANITSIQQLDGRTLALPAPNAFGASLLTRSYLDKQGIKVTTKYVNTHQNVYRGVARDPEKAGGGVNNTFNREDKELRSQLSILVETPGYPAHPFSARIGLPNKEIEQVQEAWLALKNKPNAQVLLDSVQISTPSKADYARDYSPLKSLYLEQYLQ